MQGNGELVVIRPETDPPGVPVWSVYRADGFDKKPAARNRCVRVETKGEQAARDWATRNGFKVEQVADLFSGAK